MGIDVLAVIDREMEGWEYGSEPYEKLRESRAAIAELIESLSAERKHGVPSDTKLYRARSRTDIALANCIGGAA